MSRAMFAPGSPNENRVGIRPLRKAFLRTAQADGLAVAGGVILTFVPYLTERESFHEVMLKGRLAAALRKLACATDSHGRGDCMADYPNRFAAFLIPDFTSPQTLTLRNYSLPRGLLEGQSRLEPTFCRTDAASPPELWMVNL
jgi:hypothetical protein